MSTRNKILHPFQWRRHKYATRPRDTDSLGFRVEMLERRAELTGAHVESLIERVYELEGGDEHHE